MNRLQCSEPILEKNLNQTKEEKRSSDSQSALLNKVHLQCFQADRGDQILLGSARKICAKKAFLNLAVNPKTFLYF